MQTQKVPELFTIAGELPELFDHSQRCLSERVNIYHKNHDLRWAKLYNRALRLLFMRHWAMPHFPPHLAFEIFKYAQHNCSFKIDNGDIFITIDHNTKLFLPISYSHALQWAAYYGKYDWEKATRKDDKKFGYFQSFNLVSEESEGDKRMDFDKNILFRPERVLMDIDIRRRSFMPLDIRSKQHKRGRITMEKDITSGKIAKDNK